MSWFTIVFIILIGILLMILDFLVIPGGVVAIIGVIGVIGGVVASFITFGTGAGLLTLLATAVVMVVTVVLTLRSKTWRKLQLKTEIDGRVNEVDERKIQIGVTGKALSRLAPMGTGLFGVEKIEVTSMLEFIEPGSEIEVVSIEGNKIIVKPKN